MVQGDPGDEIWVILEKIFSRRSCADKSEAECGGIWSSHWPAVECDSTLCAEVSLQNGHKFYLLGGGGGYPKVISITYLACDAQS